MRRSDGELGLASGTSSAVLCEEFPCEVECWQGEEAGQKEKWETSDFSQSMFPLEGEAPKCGLRQGRSFPDPLTHDRR